MRHLLTRQRLIVAGFFILILFPGAARAQERSLHWRRLDVQARLDSAGALHVKERQTMVFTGDWNGGERTFHTRVGESLQLHDVRRIAENGLEAPLSKGDLSQVDHYDWTSSSTLRWRSRLPSDPPFNNTEITYVLDYTISNLLDREKGHYRLNHDFAFPDRVGVIESFTLDLTVDSAWQPLSEVPHSLRRESVRPGQSVIVQIPLRYVGEGKPAGVYEGVSPFIAGGIALLFLSALAWRAIAFYRGEKNVGRLAPLTPPEAIDEGWLEENLFRHKPEVVGAAWDEQTAAPEVAAVLARMALEGKIESKVGARTFLRPPELHLTLKVDREELVGYERALVNALFFKGTQTSTQLIRERYKNKGFDPAKKIKQVDTLGQRLGSEGVSRRKARWHGTAALVLTGFALLGLTVLSPPQNVIAAAISTGALAFFYIFGVIGAASFKPRVVNLGAHSLKFAIPLGLLTVAVIGFLLLAQRAVPLGIAVLLGVPILALGAANSILNQAKIAYAGKRLELRRTLAAAREYFKHQLRQREPRLRDEWFPYVLAFGLAAHVDRWFRAFGGVVSAAGASSFSSSSGSFSGGGARGWSGGGGTFGGGGASGSWAIAASSMAAGVSAPSSGGSGGGGGGGGGGSSGGGGGGGW